MDPERALHALSADIVARLGAAVVACYASAPPGSFLVATAERLSGADEAAVRQEHRRLPGADLLTGSYAPAADLRSPMTVGRGWLRAERGSRELLVSAVGNTMHERWLVRHQGRALVGPAAATLVAEVSGDALRAEALGIARSRAEHVEQHPELLGDPLFARELTGRLCQVLHTAHLASVLPAEAATAWAVDQVPLEHRGLLTGLSSGAGDPTGAPLRAFAWEVHRLVGAEVMRHA